MSKNRFSSRHLIWIAPLIICLILLGAAGSAFSAIAQDGSATNASSTSSTISWSHTIGTGADRLLVVGVSYDARNSNTVSSVKLGTVNLTKLRSEGTGASNARTDLWYLKAPASGTQTITVTIGGSSTSQRNMAGAVSYTGVDQTTPFSANNGATQYSSSEPSVNLNATSGDLVVDIVCTYKPTTTFGVGPGQTQYWKNTTMGSNGVNGGMSYEMAASSVTMSWTGKATKNTGASASISAAAIKPKPAPDTTKPSSSVTNPANGATITSTASNPYTISGTATDNVAVSSIQVSTNGGTTWNNATCTGCPGASVTWTYSWTLPADGSYNIKSRATDSSSNVETAGAGNTVTVHRTGPTVSSTIPANNATGVALNSNITINWNEAVDCTTVTTSTVTISPASALTKSSCSGSQAVFTTGGQANSTLYTVTATTGVKDTAGNPMAANYVFSYTTSALACIDADGDGYGANGAPSCPNGTAVDCNDNNASIKPGALDNNCNNIDDNCNGTKDEGYVATPTSCGVGVCAATGQNICQNGSIVNTCTAGSPTGTDNNCNAIDENCDGSADNNYAPTATSCGVGACAATGQNVCQAGAVVNTCTPGTPAASDTTCNGIDDNCNGTADEGYVPTASTCGLGVCAATGQNICQSGTLVNTCTAGNPTGTDNNCNGLDENCDGTADNNYVPTATSCGVGVCARTGQNVCQSGSVVNTCTAGTPGVEGPSGNATCTDNLDNDCDSKTDTADPNCVASGVCLDADGDGYGANGDATCPNGTAVDCDDNNPVVCPGVAEICDGKDINCDGYRLVIDVNNDNDNYL